MFFKKSIPSILINNYSILINSKKIYFLNNYNAEIKEKNFGIR